MLLLKPDSKIAIVAPASACPKEELVQAIDFVEEMGLVPLWNPSILKPQKYLAQTDDFRFQDLQAAIRNPEVEAIWCLRGGYGSIRLLEALDKMQKPKRKKLFLGLSDISVLHQFFIQKWGWSVYHTPVLSRFGAGRASAVEVKQWRQMFLEEKNSVWKFSPLQALNLEAKKASSIEGKIVGGNLASLLSLQGTKYQLRAKGKFLFLEDVGERAYAIDRMLSSMRLAGIFQGVGAVLFGDFTEGMEPNGKDLSNYALKKFAEESEFPVYRGVKTGHGKVQLSLPLNTSSKISKENGKYSLQVDIV